MIATLLVAACGGEQPTLGDLETSAEPVIGGTPALTCQWPTAVSVGGCTATLVHPKLVTLAAHCLDPGALPTEVLFGEDARRPERRVAIETCEAYPEFIVGKTDIAYCTLTTAVRDIPPTPILMGCETSFVKMGSSLTLVGFGATSAGDAETANTKRWADVVVQRFVSAGQSVQVGTNAVTTCLGDSGGPLYAKLSDGTFRAVGAASLTRLLGGECVPPAYYTLLHRFAAWLETSSGLDLTPCHDADGTPNPGPDCGGFATAADRSNGAWMNGCNAGAISGPAPTCETLLDATVDARPMLDAGEAAVVRGASHGGCGCRLPSGRSATDGEPHFWSAMLIGGAILVWRRDRRRSAVIARASRRRCRRRNRRSE